ncbi:MAG: hypothetical protein ABI661_11500, partial [Gammaproteobacteria bacterium]
GGMPGDPVVQLTAGKTVNVTADPLPELTGEGSGVSAIDPLMLVGIASSLLLRRRIRLKGRHLGG